MTLKLENFEPSMDNLQNVENWLDENYPAMPTAALQEFGFKFQTCWDRIPTQLQSDLN